MSSEKAKSYHSITIGDKNTWDDWHLVPTSRPLVNPPGVRANMVDIPGGDGSLDLTEALTGFPTYSNRTGSWEFIVMNDYGSWEARYSELMAYFHGKQFRAILDDDPNYYYEGRFSLSSWSSNKNWSTVVINYNVGPYKIELRASGEDWLWDPFNFEQDTIRDYKNIQVNGSLEFVIANDIMRVKPVIEASTAMTVTHSGHTYDLVAGENRPRGLVLHPGDNTLVFNGTGTVTIIMYGGRF